LKCILFVGQAEAKKYNRKKKTTDFSIPVVGFVQRKGGDVRRCVCRYVSRGWKPIDMCLHTIEAAVETNEKIEYGNQNILQRLAQQS
jgi:hypothetical protein